jgi:hypothetical protein
MKNDIERIINEIIACVPTTFGNNKNEFIESTNTMEHIFIQIGNEKITSHMWK